MHIKTMAAVAMTPTAMTLTMTAMTLTMASVMNTRTNEMKKETTTKTITVGKTIRRFGRRAKMGTWKIGSTKTPTSFKR